MLGLYKKTTYAKSFSRWLRHIDSIELNEDVNFLPIVIAAYHKKLISNHYYHSTYGSRTNPSRLKSWCMRIRMLWRCRRFFLMIKVFCIRLYIKFEKLELI